MTREYLFFLRQMLFDADFRHRHLELRRLSELPRYKSATTTILGKPIGIVDNTSFFGMYEEVFENEIYKFATSSPVPYIIDGGANIGLATIYLKSLYPAAEMKAFEPDANVFKVLQKNLAAFGFHDVVVHQAALWSKNTELSFMEEGSDSGRVVNTGGSEKITVKAMRLRDFLTRQVDFLKLDIEGAEFEVLEDCADRLENVENLFVEYHSFAGQPQTIDRLYKILISSGFRVKASPSNVVRSPLFDRGTYLGMDFQENIYAYRETK